MFEHEQIPVHLCCNDPDNGNFSGRVWSMEIGPNMEFESRRWWSFQRGPWGPCLRYLWGDRPRIVIAGRHFPITFHKEWYGNWCWDLVHMPGEAVLELLNWAKFRKWFTCSCGETRLFNWYANGQQFTDQDLRLIGKNFERGSDNGEENQT
jgi:hypothetical protein